MNKGIAATTGEWINFINCGDSFYDKNVIARLFKDSIGENYSVVYGNTVFQYSDHTEIEANRQYGNYKFMPACHQSIFCRTHYMKQFMFDTRYKISADFDFFYKLYFTNNQYLYKDITVAVFDAMGGISSTNKYLRNKEFICIKEKKLLKRNLLHVAWQWHCKIYSAVRTLANCSSNRHRCHGPKPILFQTTSWHCLYNRPNNLFASAL